MSKNQNSTELTKSEGLSSLVVSLVNPRNQIYAVTDENGQVHKEFVYVQGSPKNYQVSCGKGVVSLDGLQVIGKTFRFRPISWRFFKDQLFNDKKKNQIRNWVEFFFIDEENALSVIAFHGYSVENLKKEMTKLIYKKKCLDECEVSVSFVERENKAGEKFYIAEFDIKPLNTNDLDLEQMVIQSIAKQIPVYRASTLQATAVMEVSYNYPDEKMLFLDETTSNSQPFEEVGAEEVGAEEVKSPPVEEATEMIF